MYGVDWRGYARVDAGWTRRRTCGRILVDYTCRLSTVSTSPTKPRQSKEEGKRGDLKSSLTLGAGVHGHVGLKRAWSVEAFVAYGAGVSIGHGRGE